MRKLNQLLMTIVLWAAVMPLGAQSYDALWKNVKTAAEKDQPVTAREAVERVAAKALAERNDAQLLRAALVRRQFMQDVSPDSGAVALRQMEAALARETRPVERALWQSALGQLYVLQHGDTAAQSRARVYLLSSVAQPDTLAAARAADYMPLFVKGADSRHYADDVLSVLAAPVLRSGLLTAAQREQVAGRVASVYRRSGLPGAVLLVQLDSLDIRPAYRGDDGRRTLECLLRLAEANEWLPLNVETYISICRQVQWTVADAERDSLTATYARRGLALYGREARAAALRNYVADVTAPRLSLQGLPEVLYPGKRYTARLDMRHVRLAQLRMYRLEIAASDVRRYQGDYDKVRKLARKLRSTSTAETNPLPDYRTSVLPMEVEVPEAGVYYCELLADGRRVDCQLMYVSRLKPVGLSMGDGTTRITAVDSETGEPFVQAEVSAYSYNRPGRVATWTSGCDGSVMVRDTTRIHCEYFLQSGKDHFYPAFSLVFPTAAAPDSRAEASIRLYTDRGIYRPGQKVRFGGWVYTRQGDDMQAVAGYKTEVRLVDSNHKEVARIVCVSDSFGNVSGDFDLPAVCMPGLFGLRAGKGRMAVTQYFRVEEYKRPTFTVEMDDVDRAYALGDTVQVGGKAQTYTGLPVVGASLAYRIRSGSAYGVLSGEPVCGEAVTDSVGRFVIDVPLVAAEDEGTAPFRNVSGRLRFEVSAGVTAGDGETVSASRTLFVGRQASYLKANWPATVCKEQLPEVTVSHTNAAGRNIEGAGMGTLLRTADSTVVASLTFATGRPFVPEALRALPSGEYTVVTAVEGVPADTCRLLLFSEKDTRPAAEGPWWTYTRRNERGDTAVVLVGSSRKDVTLFYDLVYEIADGVCGVESRRVAFSDSLLRFDVAWKPAYGDAARLHLMCVKGGEGYSTEVDVRKPQPDKRLHLRWSTFRSRLTPGQDEEWRLTVAYPDGRPADAVLMARLYDASLDAFADNSWPAGFYFPRRQPGSRVYTGQRGFVSFHGLVSARRVAQPSLSFTRWDGKLLAYGGGLADMLGGRVYGLRMYKNSAVMSAQQESMADVAFAAAKVAPTAGAVLEEAAAETSADAAADGGAGAGEAGGADATAAVKARSNFAETAYFVPALRTDADGGVALAFTLPETLTSWNFTALAHTVGMDWGRVDTTVVARKEFMVQAAVPRFVRSGDKAEVSATLRNLTGRTVSGTLRCTFSDARTGRTVKTVSEKFRLVADGAQTQAFGLNADGDYAALVCRVVAVAGDYSDGEEHCIPVLPDRVEVTRTLPFSMTGAGRRTLRIDTLWTDTRLAADRRLTVETVANPTWQAVTALPALAAADCHSATEWAGSLYAVGMADYMARREPAVRAILADSASGEGRSSGAAWADVLRRNPELKQTLLAETPWLADADGEAARTVALRTLFDERAVAVRRHTALDNLAALQTAEGGWSWYKGMRSSRYITAEVATMLARLQTLAADRTAASQLDRALRYMEREVAADVKDMKRMERQSKGRATATSWHLQYLYLQALLAGSGAPRGGADAAYLLDKVETQLGAFNMYEKSLAAVVLARYGRTKTAADALRSLLEHTVATPEMGRWFDTDRALWSWNAYRIPTQTAAIEALTQCAGKDGVCRCPAGGHTDGCPLRSEYVEEMRLWLLQSRRTQLWKTSCAATDAIYALLLGTPENAVPLVTPVGGTQPFYYTLDKGARTVEANAPSDVQAPQMAGYAVRTYTDAAALSADALTLSKQAPGLSWGSVVAQYTLPAAAVPAGGAGLRLDRRLEALIDGRWQPVDSRTQLHRGQHVRQVLTVTADRDYDYVVLRASRAACMEPLRALSGYTAEGREAFYRVVRDASTEMCFEQVRKGTHVVTDECVVVRSGQYQCGTAGVQCVYAPEFAATAPAVKVTVR